MAVSLRLQEWTYKDVDISIMGVELLTKVTLVDHIKKRQLKKPHSPTIKGPLSLTADLTWTSPLMERLCVPLFYCLREYVDI